jgi:hypothetical protein
MPTRFTAEQLAASATAGDPRTEDSFGGDRDAWHAYQAEWFATITLGEVLPPVGDNNRAKRWKAARRQRGKIEAQRDKSQNENAGDAATRKRLRVSDQWVAAHVPALRELQAPSPVATPGGKHATRQLSALVATPEGGEREYSEQVCYSLPPSDGEPRWKAEQRDDRHRGREQLALERLQHAPERELQAQQQAAEVAAAAAAAQLTQEAEAAARRQRMAAVVRDGNTLYDAHTFKRIDPATRSSIDQRVGLVFFPDGSSCFVPTPYRKGRRVAAWAPYRLAEPWTQRTSALPPLDGAPLDELRRISTAMLSRSDQIWSHESDRWRQKYLLMEACCDDGCRNNHDCVTFRPPGQPPSAEVLARLRVPSGGERAWEPCHVSLDSRGCWEGMGRGPSQRRAADAVARAAFPGMDPPPPRTTFTPIAARLGLPLSLQYIQEGDVVLYRQEPHFVSAMNGLGGGELLLRTPEQHGRGRGLANGGLADASMLQVATLLEPARDVDVEWARAVADAVKVGAAAETLPPQPPQPPVWRFRSARRRKPTDWTITAKEEGLARDLQMLQLADVVTWQGRPHFVVSIEKRMVRLLEPCDFARKSLGLHPPWGVMLELPYRVEQLASMRFPPSPEELEAAEERAREREQCVADLKVQLALADDATAEAARAAADAEAAACPVPHAPAPAAAPEAELDSVSGEEHASKPESEPESEPDSEPDGEPDCVRCRCQRGGRKKKTAPAFARLMERMGEDVSWMDSDSDDSGSFVPF